ncbi:hypothetical protein ACVME5_006638 [Bradyrhizobium liaoningense]
MAEMPVVDEVERKRVRNGLVSYKELHRIGDPELRERMEYQGIQVALRSLQRFIAGTHRTDDIMVRRYAKFLSKVAPPPVEDEFGASLSKFLAAYPQDITAFAGDYHTFVRARQAKAIGSAGFTVGCSQVRLSRAADVTFLRATEFMNDPDEASAKREVSAQVAWMGNTGVFAALGGDQYLLMVRSLLETRLYTLRKVSDAPRTLHGYALKPASGFSIAVTLPNIRQDEPVSEFVMIAAKTGTNRRESEDA